MCPCLHTVTNPCQNPGKACLAVFFQTEGMFDGLKKEQNKDWGEEAYSK